MTDTHGQKPSRLETRALFQEIAKQTYLPEEVVRVVVDTLASVMQQALVQGETVVIRGFGTFQARKTNQGGFDGTRIRFKPAADYKKVIQEVMRPMEKYGVETKTDEALVAQVTGKCPSCKQDLESVKPPKCPNCGTEPFESKEKK